MKRGIKLELYHFFIFRLVALSQGPFFARAFEGERACSTSSSPLDSQATAIMHCRATSHASAGPRVAVGGVVAGRRARIRRQGAGAGAGAASSSSSPNERRPLDPYLAAAAQGQTGSYVSSQRMPRPPSAVAMSPSDFARASADDAIVVDADDADSVVVVAPEDFSLPAGVLGPVADKTKPLHPADVYRCSGCTKPECQVSFFKVFCFQFRRIGKRETTTAAHL